jgi:alkanesulfonate monooxygenase SsuD/methylene tetrahydromethanopterin reductase-like flavin-dependent oxidoreductase (luciferase family)
MLELAGREGDGAILNWLAPEDVATVTPYVHAGGEGKEIVARIFVCPTEDREKALGIGRRAIAAYLNVPVYAKFHEWLGRGDQLQSMWDLWRAGDRKAALEAIPEALVDALVVHGHPDACRERIQAYVEHGVHTPAIALMGLDDTGDLRHTLRALSPAGG